MKKFVNASICILLVLSFSSASAAPSIKYPFDIGKRPESITKAFDNDYFVTVMNGKDAGDAVIVRLNEKGEKSVFATGFDEPKGIAYVDGHLFISDLKRVWRIDSAGNAVEFASPSAFPNAPSYLNDVAAAPDGTGIYITDMGANTKMRAPDRSLWPLDSQEAKQIPLISRLYFISLDGKVEEIIPPSDLIPNLNGVGFDNNGNIMVAEFFTGKVYTWKDGALSPMNGVFRGADAIEQDSKGNYYVSSWDQGKVWKIDGKSQAITVISEGHQSAADFYLDETNNRLLLPDMLAGTISEVSM